MKTFIKKFLNSFLNKMEKQIIGLASDHAGYALKQYVKEYLELHGIAFKDYGCYSEESCDYPDFAHAF